MVGDCACIEFGTVTFLAECGHLVSGCGAEIYLADRTVHLDPCVRILLDGLVQGGDFGGRSQADSPLTESQTTSSGFNSVNLSRNSTASKSGSLSERARHVEWARRDFDTSCVVVVMF